MGCSGVAQLNPIAHEVCLSSSRLISQVYKKLSAWSGSAE